MKAVAAVVLVRHGELVLALTRGRVDGKVGALADLHLPGGKEEPVDKRDLRWTGARELFEETGLRVEPSSLRHLVDYVTRSGRPISAFECRAPEHAPESFALVEGHAVGWVPPAAIIAPWCTFAVECATVLGAAGIFPPQALCPDCDRLCECVAEHDGTRLPVHARHGDRSDDLCFGSAALLSRDGRSVVDEVTVARLQAHAASAAATAETVIGLRSLQGQSRRVRGA